MDLKEAVLCLHPALRARLEVRFCVRRLIVRVRFLRGFSCCKAPMSQLSNSRLAQHTHSRTVERDFNVISCVWRFVCTVEFRAKFEARAWKQTSFARCLFESRNNYDTTQNDTRQTLSHCGTSTAQNSNAQVSEGNCAQTRSICSSLLHDSFVRSVVNTLDRLQRNKKRTKNTIKRERSKRDTKEKREEKQS